MKTHNEIVQWADDHNKVPAHIVVACNQQLEPNEVLLLPPYRFVIVGPISPAEFKRRNRENARRPDYNGQFGTVTGAAFDSASLTSMTEPPTDCRYHYEARYAGKMRES